MFSLFANEKRFRLLCALSEADACVSELCRLVGGTPSNISQQLKMLALAGYLERTRHERTITYHLKDTRIRDTIAFLRQTFGHA